MEVIRDQAALLGGISSGDVAPSTLAPTTSRDPRQHRYEQRGQLGSPGIGDMAEQRAVRWRRLPRRYARTDHQSREVSMLSLGLELASAALSLLCQRRPGKVAGDARC